MQRGGAPHVPRVARAAQTVSLVDRSTHRDGGPATAALCWEAGATCCRADRFQRRRSRRVLAVFMVATATILLTWSPGRCSHPSASERLARLGGMPSGANANTDSRNLDDLKAIHGSASVPPPQLGGRYYATEDGANNPGSRQMGGMGGQPQKDKVGVVQRSREWLNRWYNLTHLDLGISRRGNLACRWRKTNTRPVGFLVATDGEWSADAGTKFGEYSEVGFNLGTHGTQAMLNLGVPLGNEFVGRYCFNGVLKAPNYREPSPFFLQMPPLSKDAGPWSATIGQRTGIEHPLIGGNASVHLFHINDDVYTGFFYRRRFPDAPGTPLLKTDITTKGASANVRVRRQLQFVDPRLGAAASLDVNKPWVQGPAKITGTLELLIAGLGRIVAIISGNTITIRPIFGDMGDA